jgi:hypothetical protein
MPFIISYEIVLTLSIICLRIIIYVYFASIFLFGFIFGKPVCYKGHSHENYFEIITLNDRLDSN